MSSQQFAQDDLNIFSVSMTVLIHMDSQLYVFLSTRADTLTNGGYPVTTGGTIQFGENPLEGAIRKCRKEHGIKILPSNIIYSFVTIENNEKTKHFIAIVPQRTIILGSDSCNKWKIESKTKISSYFPDAIPIIGDIIFMVALDDLIAEENVWKKSVIRSICEKFKYKMINLNV